MKTLSIITCLGVILGIGGATYSSMQYISLSNSAAVITSLSPSRDIMGEKIESVLADHNSKNLILNELKSRYEHSASLHSALVNSISTSKTQAVIEILMWISASIFFVIMLVRIEVLRRQKLKGLAKKQ